jgi:hypothetical protein
MARARRIRVAGGDIEGVIGAAEGALVADAAAQETKAKARGAGDTCANCGVTLEGAHCHVCGQLADDLHRPIWSLVADAFEGLFSLDGRFLKTVPALLFQPGRVSANYLKGARARFVQPFRLYLFSAVVFLLAVSIVAGDWTNIELDGPGPDFGEESLEESLAELDRVQAELAAEVGPEAAAGLARAREGIEAARAAREAVPGDVPRGVEVVRAEQRLQSKCAVRRELLPEEPVAECAAYAGDEGGRRDIGVEFDDEDMSLNLGGIAEWPLGVRRRLMRQADTVIDDPSRFLEAVNRWISRVLISLFPVYALLLAIMHFWKRRLFFYDHMIVSLHFHAFLFLILTILIASSAVLPFWLLCVVFVIWSNIYLYKTHRLVYGSGRFTAALRTLVLDFLYLIILSFVPVVLMVGGFLTA